MATAPANSPGVIDLPVAPATVEERKAVALEAQAAAMTRNAAAVEAHVAALQAFGGIAPVDPAQEKAARFERMLRACVEARVATTVEGFVNFAREMCDACDREFPPAAV